MSKSCPSCCPYPYKSEQRTSFTIKAGVFYRASDRKKVQRYFCTICRRNFSSATYSKNYRQKRRDLNLKVVRLLVSNVSQRESARILQTNKKTVARKLLIMGARAKEKLAQLNSALPRSTQVQFDDMESFEHTKCKPLSIFLAVEEPSRRILSYAVARMPAKGLLSRKALKKYGFRKDERAKARRQCFEQLTKLSEKSVLLKSDECPHYPGLVRRYFPGAIYKVFKGRRGSLVGQGELKKIGFDPLFSLNHTAAVLRARTCRLIRRTWCTTKKPECLDLHLALVCLHHNQQLNL